jgi:hypothetical protein
MKKHFCILSLFSLLFFSCGTFYIAGQRVESYNRIDIKGAEIINENTLYIYFSDQLSEIDLKNDIKIIVNDNKNYYITHLSFNIFADTVNGLIRYSCKLNKNIDDGDNITITGRGPVVFGNIVIKYKQ